MKKFGKLTIMKKIYLAIFSLCTVFFSVTLAGSTYSRKQLEKEVIRNNNSKNEFWVEQWNTQINALSMEESNILNDEALQDISVRWDIMNRYDQIHMAEDLSDRLIQLKLLHSIIEDARVCFLKRNMEVSANHRLDTNADVDLEDFKDRVSVKDGNIYLTYYFPKLRYSENKDSVSYIVQAELGRDKLERYLDERISEEDKLYLLSEKGEILAEAGQDGEKEEELWRQILLSVEKGEKESFHTGKTVYASSLYSEISHCYLVYEYPRLKVDESLNFFVIFHGIIIVVTCSLFVIFMLAAYRVLQKPITRIMGALENNREGFYINEKETDEFTCIYSSYNQMISEMNSLIHQKVDMEYELKMAQLRQLQYQIQPHFLYNSIFTIFRMATLDENEEIAEYSKNLGQYYQYITKLNGSTARIREELQYLKNYLYIQETRFGDRIRVVMDPIDEKVLNLEITPLVLQPLVENAYQHGMKEILSGGLIHISAVYQNGIFIFTVEDNGTGIPEEELLNLREELQKPMNSAEAVHGLVNVCVRIKRIYGEESSLYLENRPEGGTKSVLKIRMGEEIHV